MRASEEYTTIGHFRRLSGPAKEFGDHAGNGFQLAVKEVNRRRGLLGRLKLQVLTYEEGYDAETATASANKAIADGAVLAVGGVDALSCIPLAAAFVSKKKPLIVTSCGSERPTLEGKGWVVHLRTPTSSGETDSNALSVLARWMLGRRYTRVAAIGLEHPFVRDTDQEFARVFNAEAPAGFTYSGVRYFPSTEGETRKGVAHAVARNPDLLYMGVWGREIVETSVKHARELGYEGDIMLNEYALTQAQIDRLGPLAEDIYSSVEWLPDRKIRENKAFVDAYTREYQSTPDIEAMLAYMGAWQAALALDRAGCADGSATCQEKIRDAIREVECPDPAGGSLKLTPWGRRIVTDWFIIQARRGNIAVVDRMQLTYDQQTQPGIWT